MAKIRYGDALSGQGSIADVYGDEFTLTSSTRTSVTFDDGSNQREMIWIGEGFRLDGDTFTKGSVERILFSDDDDVRYLTIIGTHLKATTLMERLLDEGLAATLEYILNRGDFLVGSRKVDDLAGFAGTDWLKGHAGRDHLWGGAGHDRLTGGEGADWFEFKRGDGKDYIEDFDADPAGGQDLISWNRSPHYDLRMSGHDAQLDFGDGDILVLRGVHKNEIDATDFS